MQIIKNKKAISGVVSSVIIILAGITAIALLSTYIINTISLSPQYSCTELQINEPISIKKSCYNRQTNDVELTLSRKLNDIKINSLGFSLLDGEEESKWLCSETCGNCNIPKAGSTKTYYFSSNVKPNKIIISADSCALASSDVENCS